MFSEKNEEDEKEKGEDEYVDIGINITSDLFGTQRKKKKEHWEDVLVRAARAGVTYVVVLFDRTF